jgi:MerR family transcriptional regulator, copper efflux regulator
MNNTVSHATARQEGFIDIGSAAHASGVSIKMIRHYETLGLLGAIPRTEANYRVYAREHIHTLRFIARSRKLGFSIEEIRALLGLWQDRQRSSAAVKEIAARHIEDLQARITELQGMVDTLSQLTACCAGDHRPDCPILADLAGDNHSPQNKNVTEGMSAMTISNAGTS